MARVLLLSPYEPPPDGIGRHSGHLVNAWDAAGHSVLVIAPGRQSGLGGAEAIGSTSKVARALRRAPRGRTWSEILAFAPDVVVAQFAISALGVDCWSVIRLCKKFSQARVPVVATYHEPAREYDLLGFITRRIYRAVARVTDVPIVFSAAGRQALTRSGLFEEVTEVPHGTSNIEVISEDDIKRVRALHGVTKPLVLALGFTSPDKGTDVLLDAAQEIASGRNRNVQFLIAGSPRKRRGAFRLMGHRDEKFQTGLEVQASDIADVDIAFSGYVANADIAALLFLADVVTLPYRRITQSGIANMAMASRSVVVCSDLPGLRSDLGEAAKYVKVGDAHDLAEKILSLVGDENASERSRLRELSRERATANSYRKVAEKILGAGLEHIGANRPA